MSGKQEVCHLSPSGVPLARTLPKQAGTLLPVKDVVGLHAGQEEMVAKGSVLAPFIYTIF